MVGLDLTVSRAARAILEQYEFDRLVIERHVAEVCAHAGVDLADARAVLRSRVDVSSVESCEAADLSREIAAIERRVGDACGRAGIDFAHARAALHARAVGCAS
jgi:hypothetical protein